MPSIYSHAKQQCTIMTQQHILTHKNHILIRNGQALKLSPSPNFRPATAPAPTLSLPLDVHHNIHASSSQELHCPLPHVFEIRRRSRDHVNDAQNLGLSALSLSMVVMMALLVTVAVILIVSVAMGLAVTMIVVVMVSMAVIMTVLMIMRMSFRLFVLVAMIVSVIMTVIVMAVAVIMIMIMSVLMGVSIRMRLTRVFEPEAGNSIADDPAQAAQLLKRVAQSILDICRKRQHQAQTGAADQRDGRGKDKHRDDAGCDRVPAGPSVVFCQQCGDDDGQGAERVGHDVQEDALHVLVVVVVMGGNGDGCDWRCDSGGGRWVV